MKLSGISVGNQSPRDNRTLEQFRESKLAQNDFGKCLIALVEESVWSQNYTVYGDFHGDDSYLRIGHPAFLPDKPLMLMSSDRLWTVREVEIAIRNHLRTTKSWTRSVMALVQNRAHEMGEALEAIPTAKAKAEIVANFPEAIDVSLFQTNESFYAFMLGNNIDRGNTYVIREVDGAFTGGVTKINCSPANWYAKRNGFAIGARASTFFGQLALQYVARWLGITEDKLKVIDVVGTELPIAEWFNKPGVDRFAVAMVTLNRFDLSEPSAISVDFRDNLPFKVAPITVVTT